MELKSFRHNGISWKCRVLGERALFLEPDTESEKLRFIHELNNRLEHSDIDEIQDVIPAYDSISIVFNERIENHNQLIDFLNFLRDVTNQKEVRTVHKVRVCYDLGLDWKELEEHSGLKRAEIAEKHSSKKYSVAMLGFIPGFIFLDGLEDSISCPRKSSPRTNIPAGSIGIGGKQTGIYSLQSPGGWNIIGRTPTSFFDIKKNPPTVIKAGDKVQFIPISESEFREF